MLLSKMLLFFPSGFSNFPIVCTFSSLCTAVLSLQSLLLAWGGVQTDVLPLTHHICSCIFSLEKHFQRQYHHPMYRWHNQPAGVTGAVGTTCLQSLEVPKKRGWELHPCSTHEALKMLLLFIYRTTLQTASVTPLTDSYLDIIHPTQIQSFSLF